jgi:hypothetical protein
MVAAPRQTSTAPRIPNGITQAVVASFLSERLELREGLYLWQPGFDAAEVQASVELRWGRNAWERVRKQAWRIAVARADGGCMAQPKVA